MMQLFEMGTIQRWEPARRRAADEYVIAGALTTETATNGFKLAVRPVLASDRRKWYTTKVGASAEGILVGCDCPAGQSARPCKHLARVLMDNGTLEPLPPSGPEPVPPAEMLPEDRDLVFAFLGAERGEG